MLLDVIVGLLPPVISLQVCSVGLGVAYLSLIKDSSSRKCFDLSWAV